MKATCGFLMIGLCSLLACSNPEAGKTKTEAIVNDFYLLNGESLERIKEEVMVPVNYLEKGDTVILEKSSGMYLFGKDSLHGKVSTVWSNSKLVYAYRFRKDLIFDVYDSLNKFVDRGALPEYVVERIMFADIDYRKIEFYDRLIAETEMNYKKIENKYSISKFAVDSLIELEFKKSKLRP